MLVYAPTHAPSTVPTTLHRRLAAAALERNGIRPATRPHAELTPGNPVTAGRAWLELEEAWNDDLASDADGIGAVTPGRVEVWLEGLKPGTPYLVAIDVVCLVGATDARFDVSSSATVINAFGVEPLDRTLMVVVDPADDLEVVILEPQNLSLWSLTSVTVAEVS